MKLQGGFNLPVCANRGAPQQQQGRSANPIIHPHLCLPSHACSRMLPAAAAAELVIMVQGEEESSWSRMASVHDHDMQHLGQATLAYHGGLHQQAHHHHHASAAPPASFLDFQTAAAAAAYFGDLEEALLINGANATAGGLDHHHHHPSMMIASDVQTTKSAGAAAAAGAGYLAGRPPTLEIFPSWPMRHQQQLHSAGNSQSVGSTTDSSSARNTMAQVELVVSPASSVRPSPPSSTSEQQRQEVMMVTTDDYSYKPGGLAAAAASPPPPPPPAVAAAQSFQQLQLHGGGDHDKRKHGSTRKDGKLVDTKTERRLAQNREAAKKSRLRKKAYVQNLETSRVRLQQMEQELQRARSQGIFLGGCSAAGDMSPGASMFNMEYARWLDDDGKRLTELRGGLQAHLQDSNLGLIVEECMQHYDELFQLKAELARSDVFHLLTGAWATPAERCFFWMGGFRPSELLKILTQQLDPLTEQQLMRIYSLTQSSEQAEEALAQGLQQLHQSLADTVAAGTLNDGTAAPSYMGLMAIALEKLASLESFYQQADNLRQQTLHQMRGILTTRQAARCFLSIGEYYRRLRALSSLWASRPRENFIGTESLSPTGTELQGMHHQLQQNQFSGF